MKKFLIILIIPFCFMITFITGCNNNFKHKTINFEKEPYFFEVTVKNINNYESNSFPNIYSQCLDVEIEIKNKTQDGIIDYNLNFFDFEFYLTEEVTIYKTYMYINDKKEEIQTINLKSQTTTNLHLCLIYSKKATIENQYIIKLWNKRI